MADDDVKLSEEKKEEVIESATKTGEQIADKVAAKKANETKSAIEEAVSAISSDATFEEKDDKLHIEVPLVDEEHKQAIIDKLVAQKLAAAEAEAEKIAQEKAKEAIAKMAAEKEKAALLEAQKKAEEVKPVKKAEPVKKVEPEVKNVEPKKVEKKVEEKKVSSSGNLKVTLVKSLIGTLPNQRKTAKALGLTKKISSYSIRPNDAVTKGMINVIKHLVKVEEI